MKRCAFLSMESLAGFECYDHLLHAPMAEHDWVVETVSWRNAGIDWNRFDAVVIRSTWDYQDDAPAFMSILETVDRSGARLENPLELVKWNLRKTYLRDLERRGVEIVPTIWPRSFSPQRLDSFFAGLATDEIVIKPVVSANADNTFRLPREKASHLAPELERVFEKREFMVQPFLRNIVDEGEFSLFFFGDNYSHTILKTPKAGDFRVQEEHGGVLHRVEPDSALLDQARNVLAAVRPRPLYARADFVRIDESFALMELELIEPSLYFNMDQRSAGRFAEAFAQRMRRAGENLL